MLKVGIIGASGYSGEELIKLLLKHPQVKITLVSAVVDKPIRIAELFPDIGSKLDLICQQHGIKDIIACCDLVFLALPHTVSVKYVPDLVKAGKKVIDISADYRLKDVSAYKKWYKTVHPDEDNLKKAIYGLPEIYREKIKKAAVIANPGCYPTASILSLAPLVKAKIIDENSIVIDAKSGYSGAGRKPANDPFYQQLKENFKAYKPGEHQHMPEIEQELSNIADSKIKVVFVPHLVPMERGILTTVYCKLKNKMATEGALRIFADFYHGEPFIKVLAAGLFPQTKEVAHTNFCHIGVKVDPETDTLITISAIDNLVKGASGQAVQNMNIMYGFKETEALL